MNNTLSFYTGSQSKKNGAIAGMFLDPNTPNYDQTRALNLNIKYKVSRFSSRWIRWALGLV